MERPPEEHECLPMANEVLQTEQSQSESGEQIMGQTSSLNNQTISEPECKDAQHTSQDVFLFPATLTLPRRDSVSSVKSCNLLSYPSARESLNKMHICIERLSKLDSQQDPFSKKLSSAHLDPETPLQEAQHLNASVDKLNRSQAGIECISELEDENEFSHILDEAAAQRSKSFAEEPVPREVMHKKRMGSKLSEVKEELSGKRMKVVAKSPAAEVITAARHIPSNNAKGGSACDKPKSSTRTPLIAGVPPNKKVPLEDAP